MKNPIIGITLDFENNGGYSKFPWYAIRENYLTCLSKFGAIPFPMFHQNSVNEYFLKNLDGLVITGGNFDINPSLYAESDKGSRNIKYKRTIFEIDIFNKFNNRVVIDEAEIKNNLDKEIKNLSFTRDLFLSEILIRNSKNLKLNIVYSEILKSIKDVGFATTANIFSISNTAKIGGKVGWVKETSLSKQILKNIINLEKGQISKPIKVNENFLILGINDTKINKQKIDKNKILSNRILFKKNQQLERFSLAYFNKVKQNIQINEL